MEKINKWVFKPHLLIVILAISLFLNVYGLKWGLPDRWSPDEHVARTLRMIGEKKITSSGDFGHPNFYKVILAGYMSPFLAFLP